MHQNRSRQSPSVLQRVAVPLLLGLFAGCSSTEDADSGAPASTAPSSQAPTSTISPATVPTTEAVTPKVTTTTEPSTTSAPPTTPAPTDPPVTETTAAITLTAPNFLEFAGAKFFGEVAAGGGSVWIATTNGLIQVDPASMEAIWHTGVAPGIFITYAFDSLWVASLFTGLEPNVTRVDPATLEVIATIPVNSPEGIAAGEDGVWVSQHKDGSVVRIDPASNAVAETISVVDDVDGAPQSPSVFDGEVWLALGNSRAVIRIDAQRNVTIFPVPGEVLDAPVATPDAVWFGAGTVLTRVDRATGVVTVASLPREAVGALGRIRGGINIDGTLWFPSIGGAMLAIEPTTSSVVGSVPLRTAIAFNVVVFEGAAWVVGRGKGSLERIPLEQLVAT